MYSAEQIQKQKQVVSHLRPYAHCTVTYLHHMHSYLLADSGQCLRATFVIHEILDTESLDMFRQNPIENTV